MHIVISGASRGIGLALTREYASAGHRVVALCRDPSSASALAGIAAKHGDVKVLRADVTDASSIASIRKALGDAPVDLLLNVAGTIEMEDGPESVDLDRWASAFDVMITGPFRTTLALLPNLVAAGGKVVSISSQMGSSAWTSGGFYSYGAAKAGLNRAMKSLAVDLRERGVSVIVIHPGHVRTDMGGPNGEISPQESAQGIKAVIDRAGLDSTGRFFSWNGAEHAW
ncbi:SDR family oxidoreductase [Sphingomonas sp. 1P08PE]|uniref:SDR family oxidoreductase n=1 Tax=Sphingomonas sp. 1P08PE TaxID=554122 RepID=UPI00399F4069